MEFDPSIKSCDQSSSIGIIIAPLLKSSNYPLLWKPDNDLGSLHPSLTVWRLKLSIPAHYSPSAEIPSNFRQLSTTTATPFPNSKSIISISAETINFAESCLLSVACNSRWMIVTHFHTLDLRREIWAMDLNKVGYQRAPVFAKEDRLLAMIMEDSAARESEFGIDLAPWIKSRILSSGRYTLEALKEAIEVIFHQYSIASKERLQEVSNLNSLVAIFDEVETAVEQATIKNDSRPSSVEWSEIYYKISKEATYYELLHNTIVFIGLSPSNKHLPVIVRQDGRVSFLIEMTGLNHTQRALDLIHFKRFIRHNELLYLESRVPAERAQKKTSLSPSFESDLSKMVQHRVFTISKNSAIRDFGLESGVAEYFPSTNDQKVVSKFNLDSKVLIEDESDDYGGKTSQLLHSAALAYRILCCRREGI